MFPPDSSRPSIEPWPLHYVQTALWFLSATPADKAGYLPPPFPGVMFHGNVGDFGTGNPLYFMVHFCADASQVGSRIDEWMDRDPDGRVREQFDELHAILTAMLGQRLEKVDVAAFLHSPETLPDLEGLFNAASRYSTQIIADLGWQSDLAGPRLRCEVLLDEYSYGAYSAPGESLG